MNANENTKMNTIGRARPDENLDYFALNQASFPDTLSMSRFIPQNRQRVFGWYVGCTLHNEVRLHRARPFGKLGELMGVGRMQQSQSRSSASMVSVTANYLQ